MKRILIAAAIAAIPATGFAQSIGPIIRDPAGGVTRDPALAGHETSLTISTLRRSRGIQPEGR